VSTAQGYHLSIFSHLNSGEKIAGGWANLYRVILLFSTQLVLFFWFPHKTPNKNFSAILFHIKEPYQYAKETFHQGGAEKEIESLGKVAGYFSW